VQENSGDECAVSTLLKRKLKNMPTFWTDWVREGYHSMSASGTSWKIKHQLIKSYVMFYNINKRK
jgi:hypothetical protein